MAAPTPTNPKPPLQRRVVLADGTTAVLRSLSAEDLPEVQRLHAELPSQDQYLRFFGFRSTVAEDVARSIVGSDSAALGVFRHGALVGVANFRGADRPEIALAVAHGEQHHGIGTLLLEGLIELARQRGIPRLVADVLGINTAMLRVITDARLPVTRRVDGTVNHLTIEVPAERNSAYADALCRRHGIAEARSLRPVLVPRSIAVVGASARPDSVGGAVLRDILACGFTGAVHVVHPRADRVAGIACHRDISELPEGIDLAVVCVPAASVPAVAQSCGRRGIRALVVLTSAVSSDPALAAGLRAAADRYDMRVVGPNCLGVVNTAVGTALQATLAEPMPPGDIGVATQSGGVAIALAEGLGSLGLGVSSLLSIGDGLDVAGEDALLWWSQDGRTRAGVLYLDSLPDPELFAVVATRLAGAIPLLAVSSGASDPGARAAAWHNAAIDGRDGGARLRNAVFEQAGILTVQSLDQLCEALALLRWQHLPTGPRVGIVTNAGGAAVLAADACARHGLLVPGLSPETQQDLRGALPKLATIANPVDTSAPVSPATFAAAVDALAGDPAIDAILALSVRTALGNPLDGLTVLDRQWPRPVLAVRLGQTAQVQPLRPQLSNPPTGAQIPTYADADAAARALALAWRRARWLDSPAR